MRGFSSTAKPAGNRLIGIAPGTRVRSRQAERTEATRRKLLAAAERIFARDGFEAARLEDLRKQKTPHQKLAALRKHYAEIAKDRRLVLISVEFKLFALRHPEAHARLRDRHRRIRAKWGELFAELLRALGRTLPISNPAASACCLALAQGLLLEQLVDPKTLSEKDVRHMLGIFFDSIFRGNAT